MQALRKDIQTEERLDRPHEGSTCVQDCNECGQIFHKKDLLDLHKQGNAKDENYDCGECGVVFTEKSLLTAHMQTHTEDRS
ncbi:unnamed protein product [Acanthoscelides obtectus]|uniref:C2H2-type domain-containing protein n=1 Tax=Acanthoscelides obtectus TaxID=200917 RepID=A0A9P0JWE3_ACAOB|nr:unnamed protein product [Acanthoscelides obtectus]CAK1663717.1 Zinc finger protein 605 [Acanthoscelides obtectus]